MLLTFLIYRLTALRHWINTIAPLNVTYSAEGIHMPTHRKLAARTHYEICLWFRGQQGGPQFVMRYVPVDLLIHVHMRDWHVRVLRLVLF